jgi:isoquinoline 1-oxidoreductase subunit alpha
MAIHELRINGNRQSVDVDDDTPLLWVLRDELDLVGTKYGCGIGQCGACTVHIDGVATRSCLTTVSSIGDKAITTIEGLSADGKHPLQEAWKSCDVPQCGYCQSGQIMTAAAYLEKNPNPSSDEIRQAMHGNICRCGSYNSIQKAVETAAKS